MLQYKDIINYSVIRRLKGKISDMCIIFNNLVRKENIANRESEYYEVYIRQYRQDMDNLAELRDRAMRVADECNKIILDMNKYHIKQYYLEPDDALSEFEDLENYKEQLPSVEESKPKEPQLPDDINEW